MVDRARARADGVSFVLSIPVNLLVGFLAVFPSVWVYLAVNDAVLAPLGLTRTFADSDEQFVVPLGGFMLVALCAIFIGANQLALRLRPPGYRRGSWQYWAVSALVAMAADVTFMALG